MEFDRGERDFCRNPTSLPGYEPKRLCARLTLDHSISRTSTEGSAGGPAFPSPPLHSFPALFLTILKVLLEAQLLLSLEPLLLTAAQCKDSCTYGGLKTAAGKPAAQQPPKLQNSLKREMKKKTPSFNNIQHFKMHQTATGLCKTGKE